jgi:hypothetical protein
VGTRRGAVPKGRGDATRGRAKGTWGRDEGPCQRDVDTRRGAVPKGRGDATRGRAEGAWIRDEGPCQRDVGTRRGAVPKGRGDATRGREAWREGEGRAKAHTATPAPASRSRFQQSPAPGATGSGPTGHGPDSKRTLGTIRICLGWHRLPALCDSDRFGAAEHAQVAGASRPRQPADCGGFGAGGAAGRLDVVVVVMSFLDLVLPGIPDWLVRVCPVETREGEEGVYMHVEVAACESLPRLTSQEIRKGKKE